ncbi:hypothetical protein NKG05_02495 [Oerskovia sp. M15]
MVVPLRSDEQLTQLHRDVLSPSFPPAELVSLESFLADHAAGHLESLGVVVPDDGADDREPGAAGAGMDGQVVAGVVGSWSAEARVLLVQYLAIARDGAGAGSARRCSARRSRPG